MNQREKVLIQFFWATALAGLLGTLFICYVIWRDGLDVLNFSIFLATAFSSFFFGILAAYKGKIPVWAKKILPAVLVADFEKNYGCSIKLQGKLKKRTFIPAVVFSSIIGIGVASGNDEYFIASIVIAFIAFLILQKILANSNE